MKGLVFWLKLLVFIIFIFGLVMLANRIAQTAVLFSMIAILTGVMLWRCRS